MTIIEPTTLSILQKEALLFIWNREYPIAINYLALVEFEDYLNGLTAVKHYLLVNDSNGITGWGFTFDRNDEKWFGIILDQSIHGWGYGTKMLDAMKEKEAALNGWVMDHNRGIKADGTVYKSPLGFYIKNEFTVSDARLETEKISVVKIAWKR